MPASSSLAPAQTHAKYDRLIADAKQVPSATTIVVYPCDETSLRAAADAATARIIIPVLVGPKAKIEAAPPQQKIENRRLEKVEAEHTEDAAARAVELVHEGKGELLMKGSLHTDELMRAVTASATGL